MSITLNPYLMLLVFCLFIGLIIVLNQILYKPMLAFMDKRDSDLKSGLDSVQNNSDEIDKINKEIASIMENAREQSNAILEKANLEAKAAKEEKLKNKMANIDEQMSAFKSKLESQKDELEKYLGEQMPSFKNSLKTKLQNI